jgi:hypothetical protein
LFGGNALSRADPLAAGSGVRWGGSDAPDQLKMYYFALELVSEIG